MKIVHKLGYVIVFQGDTVHVFTEAEFKLKKGDFDLSKFTEEWQDDAGIEY